MADNTLQELIYKSDEDGVIDFLVNIDVSKLSSSHDFLSYPIRKKDNGIVRTLLHLGNVNVRANDSVALTVSKTSGNREAYDMIKEVLSDPVCLLNINFWDNKEVKTAKVYKHSRTSSLLKELDRMVSYPYKIMTDGLIIDDPQEMLATVLGLDIPVSPRSPGYISPRWSPRSQNTIQSPLCCRTVSDVPVSSKVSTRNITICISVGGETYPPERTTFLANMTEWLSPEQLKMLWEESSVNRDGTVKRLVELGRTIPHYVKLDSDDIDYLYLENKLHCAINRLTMDQLTKLVKRSIIDEKCKILRILYSSKNWDYFNTKFNPYVPCIEYTSIECLKTTIEHSGINPIVNNNEALRLAKSLNDHASCEVIEDVIPPNPLGFINNPVNLCVNPGINTSTQSMIDNDKCLLNLTFSDMSVYSEKYAQ